MSNLTDPLNNLQESVKQIILSAWDPIGINQIPEAEDEYDAYVLPLCGLIMRGSSVEEIFKYLRKIETEHIGLGGNREHTLAVAQKLHQIGS